MTRLEALIIIRETARLAGIQKAATVKAQTKVGQNEGTRAVNGKVGDGCSEERFENEVLDALGFDVGSVADMTDSELEAAANS